MIWFLLLISLCNLDEDYWLDLGDKQKEEADRLTRLLCEAGKVFKMGLKPSKELLNWWNDHEKQDKLKAKKEKIEKELKKFRNNEY